MARKTARLVSGCSWRRRCHAPRTPAGKREVQGDDGDGEDDADEPFGKDVEGAGGGEGAGEPAVRLGLRFRKRVEEERGGEQEADQHVRNIDTRKDKDAEAGERNKACVQAGAGVEGTAGEAFRDQREGCDGACERQA